MGWRRGGRMIARGEGSWRERGSKSRRVRRARGCLDRDQRRELVPEFDGVGPWNDTSLGERGIAASSRGTVFSVSGTEEPCIRLSSASICDFHRTV